MGTTYLDDNGNPIAAPTAPAAPAPTYLDDNGNPIGQQSTSVGTIGAAPATTPSSLGSEALQAVTSGALGGPDAQRVMTGIAKGAGDTVSLVSHLIHKIPGVGETLVPQQGLSALDQADVANGTEEMAGKGIENIAEFAAGDEVLKGLSTASKLVALSKKYPAIAEVLNMAKDHPILAKLITGGMRGTAVGAAQGAKAGAQKNNITGGAEAGAAGGALQGPLEAAADVPVALMRKFGLGGLTSAEAVVKAGRPTVGEGKRFGQAWLNTAALLRDDPEANAIHSVGDFEDVLHNKANDIWTKDVQPLVDKYKNEVIDGRPIQASIRAAVTKPMLRHFPDEAAAIENRAREFAAPMSLEDANETLQAFNAKLQKYYKASPGDKAAILKTDGDVASLEAAADGIRDQLYGTIDRLEGVPNGVQRQIRSQYGSLKDLERVFGKRAVVADRAAPMNIQQVLGATEAAAALAAGHPLLAAAGVVPTIIKQRASPESLVKQALSAARAEAGTPGVTRQAVSAVGAAARHSLPAAAAQGAAAVVPAEEPEIPSGFTRIQDSNGDMHDIPHEAMAAAQQRDPGLKIMGGAQ